MSCFCFRMKLFTKLQIAGVGFMDEISGRSNSAERTYPCLEFQTFVYGDPGAAIISIHLADPVHHATAGPVQKALSADGHRADAAGFIEAAVAAQ